MVGSKDLPPSAASLGQIFYQNQFREKPQWPSPGTSLAGKTAIITGGNSGLGFEAALQLLALKLSHLVLAVRSLDKGQAAAAKLQPGGSATIEVWHLDMCSYPSIQALAQRVDTQLPRADFVLLNADLLHLKYHSAPQTGHEEVVQVNYLSTALLAMLLLPVLKAKRLAHPDSEAPRLTIVNAALALAANLPRRDGVPILATFDDPKVWDRDELVDYVRADDVVVNPADPAWCKGTGLAREAKGLMRLGGKLFEMTGRTPRVGASCFVDALVNKGSESHGYFIMSWKVHPFAKMLYTPEGQATTKLLWEETLAELDFAGVRGIMYSMKA